MKRITAVFLVLSILLMRNVSYADIDKADAVDIAIDALETHFDVHREDFVHNNLDAVFVIDTENYYGAPTDQPYWKIRFGWGQAYGVAISNEGDVIALQGPGTPYYPISSTVFDNCTPGTPNEKSASQQMVKDIALEALQLQEYDVALDAMEVDIQLVVNEWYMWGEEPVWIVVLSSADEENWYVLLSNEGLVLDIASEGKLFDCSCFLH